MIKSGISMKRDMDLIRAMLMAIEADEQGYVASLQINGYTQELINYHAVLLSEAGFAKIIEIKTEESVIPVKVIIERLTWTGHEFLDAARDRSIWNQAKDKVGSATIQIWMSVLTALTLKQLGL